MAHYSEMNFLFEKTNNSSITQQLNKTAFDNTEATDQINISGVNDLNQTTNIFTGNVVKTAFKDVYVQSNNDIKNYLKNKIYDNEKTSNVYVKLLKDFEAMGKSFRIKAADLAYLKDLGVYPLNRMAILRRFPEGSFTYENLEDIKTEPISVIIGWIKPDQNFGTINFNETWTKTDKRFDEKIKEMLTDYFGFPGGFLAPIPTFAQGILYEWYKKMGLLSNSDINQETVTNYELFSRDTMASESSPWGIANVPMGDPNVLKEAPYKDPKVQNLQSNFNFNIETTYEQKLIGDVDPGSALLDILDNIYAMGTSNMRFYWGDNSPAILKAKEAAEGQGNEPIAWWTFIKTLMESFWDSLIQLLQDIKNLATEMLDSYTELTENENGEQNENGGNFIQNMTNAVGEAKEALNINNKNAKDKKDKGDSNSKYTEMIETAIKSILSSTIAVHRFELRASIELMTGGAISSTPWFLTLGNPYTPWLATNHIIVESASIETSNELGFNDMPQRITAKFECKFSRALGRQELMRMFNNSYKRSYNNMLTEVDVIANKTGKGWEELGYNSKDEMIIAKYGSMEKYIEYVNKNQP